MTPISQSFPTYEAVLDVDLPDAQALFDAVGRLWGSRHGIAAAEIANGLSAREALGTTGLGQGVAIPHARYPGLARPLATFVRPKAAIEFDAPDARPVDCFVVLLIPDDAIDSHLQLLAHIARVLSSGSARAAFRAAGTAEDVGRLFSPMQDLDPAISRSPKTSIAPCQPAAAA